MTVDLTTDAVETFDIRVDGQSIPDTMEIEEARVEQSVVLPDRLVVRILDPDFEILDGTTFAIGKELEIRMGWGDDPEPISTGEIVAIEVEQPSPEERHTLVITALDKAHRLARSVHVETYLKVSDSDLVRKVASRHGLSAVADTITTKHDHVVQSETDYAFMSRLARRNGYDWWVSGKKLYFKESAKTGSGPKLVWGETIRTFKARFTSSEATDAVEVRGWDVKTKKAIVGTHRRESVSTTTADIGEPNAKKATSQFKGERFRGLIPVHDKGHADDAAKAIAVTATSSEVQARGEVLGMPTLKAGVEVTIEGAGNRLNGKYLVTSADHIMSGRSGYITRFESGGKRAAGLVDLLGRRSDGDALWNGSRPVIGLVTNLNDPEKIGRVKVKFPTAGDDIESDWARVMGLGAGKQRGLMILPEINDEVLVVFEHGDVSRPIVIGGLWNGVDKPPLSDTDSIKDKKVLGRTITSRSGNRIELIDGGKPKEEKIVLTTSGGKAVLELTDDGVKLTSDGDITVTGKKKLTLKLTGDAALEAANIKIKAQQKIQLEAGTDIIAKGLNVKAQAQAQMELKSSAKLTADGGGMTEVKGGLVKIN